MHDTFYLSIEGKLVEWWPIMHNKLCGDCWLSQSVYNLPETKYLIKESMEAKAIHDNFFMYILDPGVRFCTLFC